MRISEKCKFLNALDLKILAMALMFCDHLWATLLPGQQWLTVIGRMAFPVFAFQIVEGYFHTHNFGAYLGRMFLFALVSEIPFNLMTGGNLLNPFHQNVMFTFCLGLLLIRFLDKMSRQPWWIYLASIAAAGVAGYALGAFTFVDYYGFGILILLTFYVFRSVPHGWVGILLCMLYINGPMMGGYAFRLSLFGYSFELHQQSFAVLGLIPIWLYNGKQGPKNRAIQYGCYAFYPAHMLILSLILRWIA